MKFVSILEKRLKDACCNYDANYYQLIGRSWYVQTNTSRYSLCSHSETTDLNYLYKKGLIQETCPSFYSLTLIPLLK